VCFWGLANPKRVCVEFCGEGGLIVEYTELGGPAIVGSAKRYFMHFILDTFYDRYSSVLEELQNWS
jgi:hypothetical protein